MKKVRPEIPVLDEIYLIITRSAARQFLSNLAGTASNVRLVFAEELLESPRSGGTCSMLLPKQGVIMYTCESGAGAEVDGVFLSMEIIFE